MKTISCPDVCAMELITCVLDFSGQKLAGQIWEGFYQETLVLCVFVCVCQWGFLS